MSIKDDSSFIQNLNPDEDFEEFLEDHSDIKDMYSKIIIVYNENYNLNDEELMQTILALSFFDCEEKLKELLISLHFAENKNLNLLNEDLIKSYNEIVPKDTLDETFLKYDILDPIKSKIANKELLFVINRHEERGYHEHCFLYACKFNSLKIAQWLYPNEDINPKIKNELGFVYACTSGSLEVAKWLYSLGITISNISLYDTFIEVLEYGYLDVAKWLYELRKKDLDYTNDDSHIFINVCGNGHLEMAQWLYSYGPSIGINIDEDYYDYETTEYISPIFISCKNDHIEIVIWLYSIDPRGFNEKDYLFYITVINNAVNVAQWLIDLEVFGRKTVNMHYDNDDEDGNLTEFLVKRGKLSIVQLLYKNSLLKLDYPLFEQVFMAENLEVAEWIHKTSKETNTEFEDVKMNNLFEWSCKNDNLELSKWFYNLRPIIDKDTMDDAFSSALRGERLDYVEWLYSIKDLSYMIENNLIDFLVVHWKFSSAEWIYKTAVRDELDIDLTLIDNPCVREALKKYNMKLNI